MLKPGTMLGPHEIISLIGAGGMGEVYKARDTRLDRLVAIKTLPAHLADRPELRERFKREAHTVANLKHPNICVLYDIGKQDGIDFLVMEYLEGETLGQHLLKGLGNLQSWFPARNRNKPTPGQRRKRWGRQPSERWRPSCSPTW